MKNTNVRAAQIAPQGYAGQKEKFKKNIEGGEGE